MSWPLCYSLKSIFSSWVHTRQMLFYKRLNNCLNTLIHGTPVCFLIKKHLLQVFVGKVFIVLIVNNFRFLIFKICLQDSQ